MSISKERLTRVSETVTAKHIARFRELFVNRDDVYAVQTKTGYFTKRETLTDLQIWQHLEGDITLGLYALSGGECRWGCVDNDRPKPEGLWELQRVHGALERHGIASYLEESRRGGHLLVFGEAPMPGRPLRRLMVEAAKAANVAKVDIYPRTVTTTGLGTLVRAPLGKHRRDGKRYGFLDPKTLRSIGPLPAQLDYLVSIERVTSLQVADTLAGLLEDNDRPQSVKRSPEKAATGVIARLREKIDLSALAAECGVELSSRGRGSCPWHPPDRHHSFSISPDGQYLRCWHTGEGSDAIDFYKRIKRLKSTKQAVRELAQRFL